MSAILKITDGTTSVSLINGPIYLESWLPSIPDYKGGGVFADSPIGESRVLVYKQIESTTDTFSIKIANTTQDATINTLRTLQNLLESAANYWTNPYANTPVYLYAKASRESSARYATIIRGRIPQLGPIMAQPFTNCPVVLDNISLSIEHHPWVGSAPGSSGTQAALSGGTLPDHQIIGDNTLETAEYARPNQPSWAAVSGPTTFERSTAKAYRSKNSLHVVASANDQGARVSVNPHFTEASTDYTVSVWVYVVSGVVTLGISDYTVYTNATESSSTTTGSWEQLTVTGQVTTTGMNIYVFSEGGAAEWYMDEAEFFISSGMSSVINIPSMNEWYVSNKRREDRLDAIYVYDNTAWSGNLLYEASPQNITGINNNEAVYFGIWASDLSLPDLIAHGGPFDNIIFNISRATGGTSPTFAWEYLQSGVGWTAIPGIVDRTSAFSKTGVNSVSWRPPTDWAADQLSGSISAGEGSATAPDDEAYWVRLRKTGGTMSNGEQAQVSTPFPYTVTWPHIELGSAEIGGDLPAKGKVDIKNYGGEVQSSVDMSVSQGADDTWFDSAVGTNNSTSTVLHIGTNYYVGLRFQSVGIEQSSQIISATIEFTRATTTGSDIARMQIRAHDVDDSNVDLSAANYANYAAWSVLPQTTAQVYWQFQPPTPSAAGGKHTTPNFATVVQEIVDRPGWASGNDLTIMIDDDASDGTSDYQFAAQDNVTYTEPILTLVWQDSAGGVWINRCIAGVRDTARGSEFVSHINMTDLQPQKGIVVKANTSSIFADNTRGAGDRVVEITNQRAENSPWPPNIPWTPPTDEEWNIIVNIDSTASQSFIGTFRAFLRVSSDVTSGQTANFSIAVRTGSTGIIQYGSTSAEFRFVEQNVRSIFPAQSNDIIPVDLGLIIIPTNVQSGYDSIDILISGGATANGLTISVYDLILMPADEWLGEIATGDSIDKAVLSEESLHFDSVSHTRSPIHAYHTNADGDIKAILAAYSQTLTFSPQNTQRMYFLFNTIDRDESDAQVSVRSSPWALTGVQVYTERKYMSLRGGG